MNFIRQYLLLILSIIITFSTHAQNVGIGTASPSEKLDVEGKVRIRGGELWFTDNNDLDDYIYGPVNRNLNVRIQANGDTDDFSVEIDNGSGTYQNQFSVNRVESYFRGNVGIGVPSPSSKFQVDGSFYVDVGNYNGSMTLFEHTGSNSPVPFNIRKSGYSGNSQSYGVLQLDMNHDVVGGGSNLYFRLKNDGGSWVEYGGIGASIQSNSGSGQGKLHFYTAGRSEKMTILNNGNVGIGTTNPGYKLQVNGSARVNSLNVNGAYNLPTSDGSSNYVLRTNGSGSVSWTDPNTLVSGDNLGNHTATQNIRMNWDWSSSNLSGNSIYAQDGNRGFAFGNGTTLSTWFAYDGTLRRGIDVYNDGSRVILGAGGANVGIGTSSPGAKLEVNGRIRVLDGDAEFYQASDDRMRVRSEGVDNVAQFASYGMYLPRTGQGYNLYLAGNLKVGHSESGHIDINDTGTRISEGNSNAVRHQTSNGYIDIGPQNNSWGHIYTDRPGFYFNKAVRAGSGNVHLNTSGNDSWISNGQFGIGTTGPTEALDVNGEVRIRGGSPASGKVLTATNGSGNTSWQYPEKSFEQENVASNGTGWRRIAVISGSGGRGFGSVSLYTTGGSYNPNYTTIHWYHNWTSSADIWVHAGRGGNFWSEARITDDGSNSYIEVYFTSDVNTLYTMTSEYGWRTATLYTGNLPSGGGNVRASASMESFNVSNDFRVSFGGDVAIGGAVDNSYKLRVHGRVRSNGINETSDARLKKNVKTLDKALDKIMALRGVNYEWRNEEFADKNLPDGVELGVIAQEVEKVLPEVVDTDLEGYKSVQYSHIVPLLIEGMKEQQKLINQQKSEIETLKAEVERIDELEAKYEYLKENIDMLSKK